MKKLKLLLFAFVLLVTAGRLNAQTPASTVYDPINGAQLVSMGTVLVTLKEQGAEVIKTLETANQIKSAAKVVELLKAIEDSYCILQDLDFYNTRAKALFKTEKNCFDSFIYSISITAIENAMSTTKMAVTSTNMSLGDRSATVTSAFNSITDSNSKLNEQKESVKKKVDAREASKKSNQSLNKMF